MPNIEEKSRHLPIVFLKTALTPPAGITSQALDLQIASFTQGFTFILAYDIASDPASDLTLTLEESPDNSNWTTIPASKIAGTLPPIINTASAFVVNNTALSVGVVGTERYIRAVAATANGTNVAFTLLGYGMTNLQPPSIDEGVPILIP